MQANQPPKDGIATTEPIRSLRFTLKQVECFLAVADAGSISKAAKQLNASESSVADAISSMERALHAKLFLRQRSRGATLTSDGRTALPLARRILVDGSELTDVIGHEAGSIVGLVRIGCVGTLASMFLPRLLLTVAERFPGLRVEYTVDDYSTLETQIEKAELDLVIAFDIDVPPEFQSVQLATTEAMVVLSAEHHLAKNPHIQLRDIATEPMVLLDISSSRIHTLELMSAHGVKPRVEYRTDDYELCRALVGRGLGYSLLMRRSVSPDTWDGKQVTYVPIKPSPRTVEVLLAWAPVRLSHRARAVVDCAKSLTP